MDEALAHALSYIEKAYGRSGLTNLVWTAGLDHRWDLYNATHHVFINKAELLSELRGCFVINPCHAGYTTRQLTVIVHIPDDPQFSHQVTLIDSENHTTWSAKVDIDGHVTEYLGYK